MNSTYFTASRMTLLMVVCFVFGLTVTSCPSRSVAQGDWPQWRGTHRDGQADSQPLSANWNEKSPVIAWSVETAGMGFSSVSVVGDWLFTMGKRGEKNVVICLGVRNGEERWATSISDAAKANEYSTGWGDGPRSTPTIDGDYVYGLCDLGTLVCLEKSNGKLVWSKHLVKDFGGSVPDWGYSESVLIDGDSIVLTPGGKHFVIALNKKTGETIWQSEYSDGAQYVSIVKFVMGNVPMYVTASKKGLVGIAAKNGETLFSNQATGNSVAVIPTPIVVGNRIYHTSAYQAGNVLLEISMDSGKVVARQLYHEKKESMENHHGGVVYHEGVIYGFSKALRGVWMAQDFISGKVLWSKKLGNATSGSIAMADGLLYCYDDQDGKCYLVRPNPLGWEEVGNVTLPKKTQFDRGRGAIWAHPVIAQRRLFIRDQEQLVAWDISVR